LLRQEGEHRIDQAGLLRAVELAKELRARADSAGAQSGAPPAMPGATSGAGSGTPPAGGPDSPGAK
jgi:hypothetical protein